MNNGNRTPLIAAVAVDYQGFGNSLHASVSNYMPSAIECVNLLLNREDIDVNAVDSDGATALIHTAQLNNIEIANLLLNKEGIDINIVDTFGRSALLTSVGNGNVGMVKILLGCDGIKKNNLDKYFELATRRGHEEVVAFILSIENIDCDLCVDKALAAALADDSKQCIKHLVADKRTNINFCHEASYAAPSLNTLFVEQPGITSLHHHPLEHSKNGIFGGHTRCSRCNNFYNLTSTSLSCSVQGSNCYSLCSTCSSEMSSSNNHSNKYKNTAKSHSPTSILIDAIVHNYKDVVDALLMREDLDVNAQDDDGNTALIFAACEELDPSLSSTTTTALDRLLSLPFVDVNHANTDGYSALSIASCNNLVGTVKRYLFFNYFYIIIDYNVNTLD